MPIVAVLNTAIRHLARVRRAEAVAAATPPDAGPGDPEDADEGWIQLPDRPEPA